MLIQISYKYLKIVTFLTTSFLLSHRYQILAPNAIPTTFTDGKQIAAALLNAISWDATEYKLGDTKIFFKAGVLGRLEEMREERLTRIVIMLQAQIRGHLIRSEYQRMQAQRLGMILIQRNVRKFIQCRNWPWWKLYTKVKPLLSIARQEEEMRAMEAELQRVREEMVKEAKVRQNFEGIIAKLQKEKKDLFEQLQSEIMTVADIEERAQCLIAHKLELEQLLEEMKERLGDEAEANAFIVEARKRAENECDNLRALLDEMERKLVKVENEKVAKEHQIVQMNDEFVRQEDLLSKTQKARKSVEESLQVRNT